MKKVKKYFVFILYNVFAKHLPKSNAKVIGKLCKKIRSGLARGFISFCGKNVNLQKNAEIPMDFSIGDDSGVGMFSVISPGTIIGKKSDDGPGVLYLYKESCA